MKEGAGNSSTPVYAAGGIALGAAALAFWQHYHENVATPPRIWLADGPLRQRVLPHCSALLRPFAPTPWAANRHAQTVLGFLRTLTLHTRYNRQHILAVDGATLGLDWFDCCDSPSYPAPPTAPVLIVCHGINGGSHEGYAKWACAAATARGWRAVVLNYRGCNGLPFTAPRGYAATMSHDVFTAVYSVKARYPDAPLVAVGYSLGGLKLTKYLAEADAGLHVPPPSYPRLFSGSGLVAAAVVSSPVDLVHSSSKLSDRGSVSFLYNLAVAYKLREHIAQHRADILAHSRFDVDSALSAWTVGEIEDVGLSASLGFRDRQHYYEEASSPAYIPAITTPTLLLLAEDDPFLGVVPDVECSRNPSTLLALTRRGGHVAFLQGAWPLGRSYMDDAVMEFFAATLEYLNPDGTAPQQQQQQQQEAAGAADACGASGAGGSVATGLPAALTASPPGSAAPPPGAGGTRLQGQGGLTWAGTTDGEGLTVTVEMQAAALAAAIAAAERSNGGGAAASGCCRGAHGSHTHSAGILSHAAPVGHPDSRNVPSASSKAAGMHARGGSGGRATMAVAAEQQQPHQRGSSPAAAASSSRPRSGSSTGGGGAAAGSSPRQHENAAVQKRGGSGGGAAITVPASSAPPAASAAATRPPAVQGALDRQSGQLQLLLLMQQHLDQQQRERVAAWAASKAAEAEAGAAAAEATPAAAQPPPSSQTHQGPIVGERGAAGGPDGVSIQGGSQDVKPGASTSEAFPQPPKVLEGPRSRL